MSRINWMLLLGALCVGCQRGSQRSQPPDSDPPEATSAKIEAKGLHNVYRITDNLMSGSSPEGDDGFRSLKELGVKTIISVDGARPDLARARRFNLRYVHLPFGYDGIPRQRVLELARAVRDLPGPVYLHCHHGKHRAPTAAAAVHLCLDDKCSIEQAVAEMRRAGTDPHYTGLYAVPQALARPTSTDLDRISTDFPEVTTVPGMAQVMVEIDARWEHLKLIRAAGWRTPPDNADLDPPHEALQLVEHYREATRLQKDRPEEFRRWLKTAEDEAADLERVLRSKEIDRPVAEKAFRSAAASCVRCHAKYRDVPQER